MKLLLLCQFIYKIVDFAFVIKPIGIDVVVYELGSNVDNFFDLNSILMMIAFRLMKMQTLKTLR